MSKHEEMARVAPLDFIASIRGTASFLRANFTDLSISEMEVIAKCLDDCAAALSRIEQETEARVLEKAADVSTEGGLIDGAIIATSVEADFSNGTWTFEPKGEWSVGAGDYYLIPVKAAPNDGAER